uniref:NADH dehydrogenase subunit 4L n=1 Tax=Lisarda rhypara TaxID=204544 RepID=UPI0028D82C18|nr:NADH dehydrogenase subunit 4L [Lisarda rhypara]WMV02034.1 NADH dehydrogenase subunit 4L [Lisarda rhypara]
MTLNGFIYLIIIMLFCGFLVFCSMRKHLLLTLLSLEFLSLTLFFLFFIYLYFYGVSYYFVMVFLVFAVCEGALGLGILVSLIRSHGGDMISSLSILGW